MLALVTKDAAFVSEPEERGICLSTYTGNKMVHSCNHLESCHQCQVTRQRLQEIISVSCLSSCRVKLADRLLVLASCLEHRQEWCQSIT